MKTRQTRGIAPAYNPSFSDDDSDENCDSSSGSKATDVYCSSDDDADYNDDEVVEVGSNPSSSQIVLSTQPMMKHKNVVTPGNDHALKDRIPRKKDRRERGTSDGAMTMQTLDTLANLPSQGSNHVDDDSSNNSSRQHLLTQPIPRAKKLRLKLKLKRTNIPPNGGANEKTVQDTNAAIEFEPKADRATEKDTDKCDPDISATENNNSHQDKTTGSAAIPSTKPRRKSPERKTNRNIREPAEATAKADEFPVPLSRNSTLESHKSKSGKSVQVVNPPVVDLVSSLSQDSTGETISVRTNPSAKRGDHVAQFESPKAKRRKQEAASNVKKRNTEESKPKEEKAQVQEQPEAPKTPNSGVKRKKRKVGKHPVDVGTPESSKASKGTTSSRSSNNVQKEGRNAATTEAPKAVDASATSAAKGDESSSANAAKPKKKKKKTFQDEVLFHLMTTMKPFTLKSLAKELRSTDAVLHNLMLSLVDKKVVTKKEVGKKIKKMLYWADLENASKLIHRKDNPLPTLEDREEAKNELKIVIAQESSVHQELKGVEAELSNDRLQKQLEEEEKVVEDMKERVQQAKDRITGKANTLNANAQMMPGVRFGSRFRMKPKKPLTRRELKMNINYMRSEWKARKEKCADFIDNLSDAMEKKPKEVNKTLEIETDESIGVKIPPKQVLDN